MANGNVRTRERFEVSLGGIQIASIVVGSLLLLGVVFFLGLEVGQRIGTRRAEALHPASLGDLDAATAPSPPVAGKDLTFPAELPRAKPPAPPPPRPSEPGAAASPPPTAAKPGPEPVPRPPPEPAAATAAEPTPTSVARPGASPAAKPAATPAPAAEARGGWAVQLGASQRREDAEILARRVQALGPRIEEADIPGKGHFFRVRVGRFESRAEAEKYKSDVIRETGITGAVIPPAN
jgi:DedD protein